MPSLHASVDAVRRPFVLASVSFAVLLGACAGAPNTAVDSNGKRLAMLQPQPKSTEKADPAPVCVAATPDESMLRKQQRRLDPLYGPVVYTEHFYGAGRSEAPPPIVVEGHDYLPYKRFDEPSTGLSGSVLLDASSGHALILFKGMDRLFVDGGLGGMLTDIHAILQSKFGSSNDQFAGAEQAYVEALCDPRIESIETIGYSLGSEFSNYLAVRYGAMGIVFGDMGIGNGTLDRYGVGSGRTTLTREQLRRNVTSLSLGGDLLVKMFGPGTVIGQVMELPGGLAGVFHQPEIYESAAKSMLQDREKKEAAVAQKVASPSTGWSTGGTTAYRTTP